MKIFNRNAARGQLCGPNVFYQLRLTYYRIKQVKIHEIAASFVCNYAREFL